MTALLLRSPSYIPLLVHYSQINDGGQHLADLFGGFCMKAGCICTRHAKTPVRLVFIGPYCLKLSKLIYYSLKLYYIIYNKPTIQQKCHTSPTTGHL